METYNFIPEEAIEARSSEVEINKAFTDLEEGIENFYESTRTYIDSKVEIGAETQEKLIARIEKIKWGLLPILSKSLNFGAEQLQLFNEFDAKTNYTMHDTNARQAIWLTDLGLTVLTKAFRDTKEYLENMRK